MKKRYPHYITLQKDISETTSPYSSPLYFNVYGGKCRCFLDKLSSGSVEDRVNTYQVVIPDPKMGAVGENWRVMIQLSKSDKKTYDLLGYVTDFAQYDRVCVLYFEVLKDNQIAGG